MSLERALIIANLSRVMGGLIFDELRKPIKSTEIKSHLINVRTKCGRKSYYHLNEELATLCHYVRLGGGDYKKKSSRELTAVELHQMQLAYEVVTGFDINKCRTRTPSFGETEGIV